MAMVREALGTVPYPGVLERGQRETSRKSLEVDVLTLLSRVVLGPAQPSILLFDSFP